MCPSLSDSMEARTHQMRLLFCSVFPITVRYIPKWNNNRAYLGVVHNLQSVLYTFQISQTHKSGRNGNAHITRPDRTISLCTIDNNCISRSESPIVYPSRCNAFCDTASIHRDLICLQSICTAIPDTIQKLITAMKVPLVSSEIRPSGLKREF